MAHTFVKYDGTQMLREQFLDNECLYINEERADKKTITVIIEFDEKTWKL